MALATVSAGGALVKASRPSAGKPVTEARQAIKRLRNAVQAAGPVLAVLEEAQAVPDSIGRYVVPADAEIGEDVLEFLRLAQQEGNGEIEIVVLSKAK